MAVNTKIVERLVQEVIKENPSLPFKHSVYDEETGRRFEVTVTSVATRNQYINESRLTKSFGSVFGPKGEPCGCCNGSGRV